MDKNTHVQHDDPDDEAVPTREEDEDRLLSPRGAATPLPPPPVRRWVTYLLAFGVSVAVGLAPLLGVLKVPLFSPLLNLIPDSLRQSLIPLTSALMGLAAVLVHWYSEEELGRTARRRALFRSIAIASMGAIAFYILTTYVVKTVPFGGADTRQTAAFLIGFSRPYRDPCNVGVSDEECIRILTYDEAKITSFWGNANINNAKLALSATYLAFMLGFASAVGIAMHRKQDLHAAND